MRRGLFARVVLTAGIAATMSGFGTVKAFTVYPVADGDVPGLIAAINASNASGGADTIELAAGGRYTLTGPYTIDTGLPTIGDSLTINGHGATIERSTAPGTQPFRIMQVSTPGTVTLSELTIRNGLGVGDFQGGAILKVFGTLNIIDSTITGNSGTFGGAINNHAEGGPLNVIRSSISGNTANDPAGGSGAAIYNYQGVVNLSYATISDNLAKTASGIFHYQGVMTVISSTFADNATVDGGANGAAITAYESQMTISNTTFSGNYAGNGGAVYVTDHATATITNSTFYGNSARFRAGALYNDGVATLTSSTLAADIGGGITNATHGNLTLANTVLAGHADGNCQIFNLSVISQGHNLSDDTSCTIALIQPGDQNNVAAGLDPAGLMDNGGPTYTVALGPGSLAVDGGDDAICSAAPVSNVDQRGVTRPIGVHCDIGAFEAPPSDTSAPEIHCEAADGLWHATNVALPCTASDSGSGLANPADASFTLTTSVAVGAETANASTDPRTVCDSAGNCATAGPVAGNMIDRKAPVITLTSPGSSASYTIGQVVSAAFSCADSGSGTSSCAGSSADGTSIDTASAGSHTFLVTATDAAGNSATATRNYSVGYNVCVLYDQTTAHKSGSTVPIRLQLCNAAGGNISSSGIMLVATSVYLMSNNAPGSLEDSGNANADYQFRFDVDKYIFNLSLKGYPRGTYALVFTAGADPTPHTVMFQVK